jgi:predicted TIM-barrel fold metal-dependent hydrolase
MHIYDRSFPVAPNAKLRPPDATVDDHRLLQKRLGLTRNVVVTPSTYGTDNSVTLDAIAKLGAAARGVAVVDASVSDAELKRLDGLGITGIRFNLVQSGATTIEMLEPLSKRVDALGAGMCRSTCSATRSCKPRISCSGCPLESCSITSRAFRSRRASITPPSPW